MQIGPKLQVMRMMCFPTSRRGLLENLPTLVTGWLGMWLCISFFVELSGCFVITGCEQIMIFYVIIFE